MVREHKSSSTHMRCPARNLAQPLECILYPCLGRITSQQTHPDASSRAQPLGLPSQEAQTVTLRNRGTQCTYLPGFGAQHTAHLMAEQISHYVSYAGNPGSIPRSGRSPGEGDGYPLQYSCLEISMNRRNLVGYHPGGRKIRCN